jgi:toxin ParE1/3/4
VSRRGKRRQAKVELTRRAAADLREIEAYSVTEWDRRTADKYLDDVAAALDRIRDEPEILKLEPDFAPGLYFYRVRKHLLACDYREGLVIVLAVLHSSMDLRTRLQEIAPQLIGGVQILRRKLLSS